MKTPDLTPAQIKADIALVLGVAASVGLNIDGRLSGLITAAAIAAFALAHFASYFADAKLRGERARSVRDIAEVQWDKAASDPVATAERLEKVLTRVVKALDAQSSQKASTQESSVKIPVTEATPGA